MLLLILALIVEGLILGALARLALPGPDPMGLGQTMLIGVAGALISGVIAALLWSRPAGLFLAFVCTFGIVYAIRRSRGGTLTRPSGRRSLR